jgi:protein-disulfide isomerase
MSVPRWRSIDRTRRAVAHGTAALALLVLLGDVRPAAGQGNFPQSAVTSPSDDEPPVRTQNPTVRASAAPDLPPAYGPSPTKVYVIVFSDFACPVCRRLTAATEQIAQEWPGDVRVEFLQLPLAMHRDAENAAVASLAAHRQGKFWPMHDLLFVNQQALDPASLRGYARQLGLDLARYDRDYGDPALRERVRREAELANRLGADSTPSFLINGALHVGWGSWMGFRSYVEQELKAANALVAGGIRLADVHALRAQAALANEGAFAAYEAAVIAPLARSTTPAERRRIGVR